MQLERRPDESRLQHHRRLIDGKLKDKTLADVDYSELSEYIYGQSYSSDVVRRMMYGSKKTLDLIDGETQASLSGSEIATEIDTKLVDLQKERQKLYDEGAAYNKLLRDSAREEEIWEIIRQCISSGKLSELRFEESPYQHYVSDNTLLVSLNDLHYGANIDNAWCRYNSDVCAQMMQKYIERIVSIGNIHMSEDCVIWAAGDCISGNIHRTIQITNKENVIEQIMGVSELIAQFIAELSKHFRTVRFISVAGNHSRIEPNKENSLTAERLDNLVEWYLSARLQNYENVIIDSSHRLDDTISMFSIRGKNYLLCHGDFDDSPAKIQALQTMACAPVYAVLMGHKHHNQTDVVQGIRTVMAGSFQGMDSFCVEKRIFGQPEQMICVCDESGIVCHYDIPLTEPVQAK